jgi:hypothetical protein
VATARLHGRPLVGQSTMELKVDALPLRATRPPILRCETRDHGQIEQEGLACRALNHGHERQSRAFLVRWLSGAIEEYRLSRH